MLRNRFFLYFFIVIAVSAHAESSRRLFFPIEKNAVQVLPQRFEYQMTSPTEVRIGNDTFRSQDLSFTFQQPKGDAEFTTVRFKWTGKLFLKGQLVLLDSTGKALWSSPPPEASSNVSSQKMQWDDNTFPVSVLNRLRLYPFFRFCLSREEERTHVLFCSRDFFVEVSPQKKWALKSRESRVAETLIEINGRQVDPQGSVFLQSVQQPILFKAHFSNGGFLDVETRLQAIEFRDIAHSKETGKLQLMASGAQPTGETKFEMTGPDEWSAEIDAERPTIFLQGAVGIPMRQEFIVPQDLRPKELELESEKDLKEKTYSGSTSISMTVPAGWKLEAGPKSSITQDTEQATWTLQNLESRKPNRRTVKATKDGKTFTAAHEVKRYPGNQWSVMAGAPLDASASYTKWWDGFYLGTRAEVWQQFMKFKTTDPLLGQYGITALVNFPKAILHEEDQKGLSAGFHNWMLGSTASPALTAGFYYQGSILPGFGNWGRKMGIDFRYHAGMGSTETRLQSAMEANLNWTVDWSTKMDALFGVQAIQSQVLENSESKNLMWLSVRVGLTGIF